MELSSYRLISKTVKGVIYTLVCILIWQAYTQIGNIPAFILPSPGNVWSELKNLAFSGELLAHLAYTARNILIGFTIGVVAGSFLGFVIQKSWILDAASSPFLVLLQAMPKIAIAPLFVLWFGFGITSQVILIISLAFFPVLTNVRSGLNNINPQYKELSQILKLNRSEYLRKVEIPSILPDLFTGAKIGLLDAMTGAILAEFITANKGLGYLLVYGNATYKTSILVASIVVIVAFGLLLYSCTEVLERKLIFWRQSQRVKSHV